MSGTSDENGAGARRLPILHREAVDYFVDNRLQEFRDVSCACLTCIDFRSPAGRELLRVCVLVDCPNCGNIVVFPPGAGYGEATCRCGERALVPATSEEEL